MNQEKKYHAKIDTFQILTRVDNVSDLENFNDDYGVKKSFVKENTTQFKRIKMNDDKEKEHVSTVLHPSRLNGRYADFDTLEEYNDIKNKMYTELTIKDMDNVSILRLDLCVDTRSSFKKCLKFSILFAGLYELELKAPSSWHNADFYRPDKINSILVRKRGTELKIYDKELESCGNALYKTRFEVSYRKYGNASMIDEYAKIDHTIKLLKRLPSNLDNYEAKRAEFLVDMYKELMQDEKIKSFSQFVSQYNEYFCTRNIAYLVYQGAGMKGKFSNWLNNYKKRNTLNFISKHGLDVEINRMCSALNYFLEN